MCEQFAHHTSSDVRMGDVFHPTGGATDIHCARTEVTKSTAVSIFTDTIFKRSIIISMPQKIIRGFKGSAIRILNEKNFMLPCSLVFSVADNTNHNLVK